MDTFVREDEMQVIQMDCSYASIVPFLSSENQAGDQLDSLHQARESRVSGDPALCLEDLLEYRGSTAGGSLPLYAEDSRWVHMPRLYAEGSNSQHA